MTRAELINELYKVTKTVHDYIIGHIEIGAPGHTEEYQKGYKAGLETLRQELFSSVSDFHLTLVKSANNVKKSYSFSDLAAAYEAGEQAERYADEYTRNGSPVPTFESWFSDFDPEDYPNKENERTWNSHTDS